MYTPAKFQNTDIADIENIIDNHSFATLISSSGSELEANHLPLMLRRDGSKNYLIGHIAKSNSIWETLQEKAKVLVIFQGLDSYISPSYYPSKTTTGRVVPTWNYVVIHVKGVISFIHDRNWLGRMVDALVEKYESSRKAPWTAAEAPASYIETMLDGIVGLEIEILSMQGKWKLSQNQSAQDRDGVMTGLAEESDIRAHQLAEFMQKFYL